jgi:hypothetical protein
VPPANTAKGTDTAAVYIYIYLAPGSKHVTAPQCRTLVWKRTRTRKQPHAAAAAAPAFRWTGPVSHELRSRRPPFEVSPVGAQIYYTKKFADITQRRRDGDYGWGVRVRRPFGARGMSSVRYGIRLGDLKENWFLCFPIKHSTHTHSSTVVSEK